MIVMKAEKGEGGLFAPRGGPGGGAEWERGGGGGGGGGAERRSHLLLQGANGISGLMES